MEMFHYEVRKARKDFQIQTALEFWHMSGSVNSLGRWFHKNFVTKICSHIEKLKKGAVNTHISYTWI